jgi:hypothetical protein
VNLLPRRAAGALVLACVFAAGRAPAQSAADQCIEANTAAQSLQRDGKLGAAGEQLKRCLDASCPGLVRDDCAQRLDELERIQPTIVFDVKDGEGHDLVDVKVSMDGQLFAERLAGTALAVDPGEHAFTFETPGTPPLVQRFVVKQGEKGRRERVVLGPVAGAPPVALTPAVETESGLGTQRKVALGVFGVGLVALGAGIAFAVEAKQKDNDADALCGTTCSNSEGLRLNHEARTAGNWATGAFIVSAATIGGATILWLTAKPSSANPSVNVGITGGMVRLRGPW